MANANAPRGLVPYRRSSGEPYNGAANLYYVPASVASNIFPGDPVTFLTNAADANGVPAVTLATAGSSNYILGAMVSRVIGGDPAQAVTRDQVLYTQSGVGGYILVADDPDLLYMVQENGNMGAGAPGRNVNLVSGSGSTQYGVSGWQLNSSSLATTNTLQMKVLRALQEGDNAPGTYAKWLCRINLNALTNTTGV